MNLIVFMMILAWLAHCSGRFFKETMQGRVSDLLKVGASLLIPSTLYANAPITIPPTQYPIVYTGVADFNMQGKATKFIARLHLLKTGMTPSGNPVYQATLNYYLGDDASNEYVTHSYDPLVVQTTNREAVLFNASNPRSPNIKLVFSEDAERVGGAITIFGQRVGTLALKSGWDYEADGVEAKYGGQYTSQCRNAKATKVNTTRIVTIAPNRLAQPVMSDLDPLDNELEYTVNGLSDYITDSEGNRVVSFHYPNSRIQLLGQRLLLSPPGAPAWICQRLNGRQLQCNSDIYGSCALTKVRDIHHSMTARAEIPVSKVEFHSAEPEQPLNQEFDCKQWNRRYSGFIKHRIGDRLQPLQIVMTGTSIPSLSGGEDCMVSSVAKLSFGHKDWSNPLHSHPQPIFIHFVFNQQSVSAQTDHLILNANAPAEVTLDIRRSPDGRMSMHWVSSIAGHIGITILAEEGDEALLPTASLTNMVQPLCGTFVGPNSFNRLFNAETFTLLNVKGYARAAGQQNDSNPYSSIEIEGFVNAMATRESDFPSSANSTLLKPRAYYDYYSNYFLYEYTGSSQAQIIGQMTESGLLSWSLKAVEKHSSSDPMVMRRVVGP